MYIRLLPPRIAYLRPRKGDLLRKGKKQIRIPKLFFSRVWMFPDAEGILYSHKFIPKRI
jgi:hypothetical protein